MSGGHDGEAEVILASLLTEIYPEASAAERRGGEDAAAARAAAAAWIGEHASDCVLALVHGSAATGRAGPYSDVDMLVVRPDFAMIRKSVAVEDGRYLDIVEAGAEHLDRLLASARASGNDWIVSALAKGEAVVDRWAETARLRAAAAGLLAAGPDPAPGREIEMLRATITAQVSDLCRSRSGEHRLVAGLGLFAPLTALLLKQHGAWSHRGKHLANQIEKIDPALNERIHASYADLLAGRPETLALLARDILAPCGGWLTQGFSNASPLSPLDRAGTRA
jgi:Nucleotidyltransferase domain